jgi:hypothetical protein
MFAGSNKRIFGLILSVGSVIYTTVNDRAGVAVAGFPRGLIKQE